VGFVLRKHHREPLEKGKAWRAKTQLDFVESDLYIVNVPCPPSARYVLTFIDEFSNFTWIYFLKTKDVVFEKFKEFRAFIEK